MDSPGSHGLQKLHLLDKFSPDFPTLLKDMLDGEKYRQCVSHLERGALEWLVNYLDKVCRSVSFPCSSLKFRQTLDHLDSGPPTPVSLRCLQELRSTCSTKTTLPTSCKLPSHPLRANSSAVSSSYNDSYEGILSDSRACTVMRVQTPAFGAPSKVRC